MMSKSLSKLGHELSLVGLKEKMKKWWLPALLMVALALSRIPGLLPNNFSAVYALVFCAGVFFAGRMSWWLPLGTMLVSDIALNFYYAGQGYDVWKPANLAYQLFNYVAYIAIILLGKRFKPTASFLALLGGGILGALLFYLITNTASWLVNPFNNPEYTKTFMGWITALIKGTSGWPQTWEFFRNTMMSSALFTALFAATAKLTAPAESPADKEAGVRTPEAEGEPQAEPEEAKA
jgi:hypothetical protein